MQFHLFCNGNYISSHWTKGGAEIALMQRSSTYKGDYAVREGTYTVGHGFEPKQGA